MIIRKWSIIVGMIVLLSACNSPVMQTEVELTTDWSSIETSASDKTVNMYMWGGSESINRYLDEWLAPRLMEEYSISLNRVPLTDTKDSLTQLLDEKLAGKETGSIDIIWINGENFKAAKDNNLLWKPFSPYLPNVKQYVDQQAPQIANDFGVPVEGLQAPWGTAQFVMTYDHEKIPNPPRTMEELKDWVIENPGKFTYPAPPDFTGSAFVRQVLNEIVGTETFQNLDELSETEMTNELEPLWAYLNEIEPYLWRQGQTYPESLASLDQMYSSGEVWMTMAYDPVKAAAEVKNGRFSESTRTFLWESGTVSNTHYLAIPFNSQHPDAAMVVINKLLSPEAQLTKLDPNYWGDLPALDLSALSEDQRSVFQSLDLGKATLPLDQLEANRLSEIPANYVEMIEKGWLSDVAKK